jgi:hypothetical protein
MHESFRLKLSVDLQSNFNQAFHKTKKEKRRKKQDKIATIVAGPRVFDYYWGQVHIMLRNKRRRQIVVLNSNPVSAKKWFLKGAYFIFWVLVH